MKLGIAERLVLLSILPREGDFTSLKLVRQMRENLSFSEEEHKNLNFVQHEDLVTWNEGINIEKDIHFGEKQTDIIVKELKQLNDERKLREEHYTLYEKFVEGK